MNPKILASLAILLPSLAAATLPLDSARKTSESQIRTLLEPIFTRYCAEECRILGVDVKIDLTHVDEAAPGFEDVDPRSQAELAPVSADVKLLMDEKLGPTTRFRVLGLATQYLEGLEYPVKITPKLTKFPSPAESATRVAELRERITKQFRGKIEELIAAYCPRHCLISDYELQTELVNLEEAQFGNPGEYFELNGVALRIKNIGATLLMDESIPTDDRQSLVEMAILKTNAFKNLSVAAKSMRFPRIKAADGQDELPGWHGLTVGAGDRARSVTDKNEKSTVDSRTTADTHSTQRRQENTSQTSTSQATQTLDHKETSAQNFSRTEKIERVESGDALHEEFKVMKGYGLIFAGIVIAMLAFIALAGFRPRTRETSSPNPAPSVPTFTDPAGEAPVRASAGLAKRFETQSMVDELSGVFAEQPRVAKHVFTRVLTEDGLEAAAAYLSIFGETIFMEMLRDPSLQTDLNGLMDYYARTAVNLSEDERFDLIKKLHHRTASGKLAVMASRTSHQFDFLADMDGTQILELVANESTTVKAIVLTQCDTQKRTSIFGLLDAAHRMKLMSELSRIDYLPKDYIQNVAAALKRKRLTNPRLNTEALPGSEVLVNLLERSEGELQFSVMRALELNNPESARIVKNKLVSVDTLGHLPEGSMLEVILTLKHEELVQFLRGARPDIRQAIFTRSPADLVADLEEALAAAAAPSRDAYLALERRVINRIKVMAQDNLINLNEVNDRMFAADTNVSPLQRVS